ncbi:hypothetical protein L596_023655 [Steinernema carpocapsae]|uniref:CHK kinase-like domain-containing protein n=1 Tax=Steinernema carpocapsae TaxID=34508 RepID=A0A4U5MEC4_STECR|nr:hypothetical protein L596_023655 [Steinernema carpocapsae]
MKPEVFEDRINHVLEFSNTRKFHDYTSHSIYQEIGLPAVLVHGDLWCNNIMWKNDSEEVAAFIDFQLTHTGSPAFDIARVLVLCADGDIRREHAHAVLEHYFSTLTELMAKEGKPVGFTMDQLERAYNVHLVNQTIHLLFMVPFFCCGDHDEKMKPVWEARTEKMMMRALFALDDALEILKTIPEEKYKP